MYLRCHLPWGKICRFKSGIYLGLFGDCHSPFLHYQMLTPNQTVLTVTNKGQSWTYRAILRGDPFQAPAQKRDAETLAAWVFHRSDLLCELWSFHILSHLLVKILVHNLSLVNFETEGLEIPIQFGKTFWRKLRKPKFHQSF